MQTVMAQERPSTADWLFDLLVWLAVGLGAALVWEMCDGFPFGWEGHAQVLDWIGHNHGIAIPAIFYSVGAFFVLAALGSSGQAVFFRHWRLILTFRLFDPHTWGRVLLMLGWVVVWTVVDWSMTTAGLYTSFTTLSLTEPLRLPIWRGALVGTFVGSGLAQGVAFIALAEAATLWRRRPWAQIDPSDYVMPPAERAVTFKREGDDAARKSAKPER